MPSEYKQSFPLIFIIFFAIVTLFIGAVFLVFEPWISVVIWILGLGIPAAIIYFHTSYVIRCDELGFTVEQKSRRKGEKKETFTWPEVSDTRYYEIESQSKDDRTTTTAYFEAHTAKGLAFKVGRIRGFHDLIQTFNQHTPHLPYLWERQSGFGVSLGPVSAGKAAYRKVAKPSATPPMAPPPLPRG